MNLADCTANILLCFKGAGCKAVKLPAKSPNLNAYAERFVRSIKESCLHRLILFGEKSLKHVVKEFILHYNHERNHQEMENMSFPDVPSKFLLPS